MEVSKYIYVYPARTFIRELFPAPLAPMMADNSPAGKRPLTPLSIALDSETSTAKRY
jgi:hypothetical protein